MDWTYTGYGPLRAGGLGALDPMDELATQALAFAEAGRPVNGDPVRREHFWRHYVEPETHWPMYDFFLARDDLPRFFELYFNSMSAAVHRDFRVGCEARDGVVSCAPGDAERWSMTRAIFVREGGGYDGSAQTLYLLQALPRCWLKPGCRTSVRDMGTSFGGCLSLDVAVSPDGGTLRVSVRWSGFAVKPALILARLRCAEGTQLQAVEVNGVPVQASGGHFISLSSALSGKFEIVARFGVLP